MALVFGGLVLAATTLAASISGATAQALDQVNVPLSLSRVFTIVFVTLGPVKIIGPFSSLTRGHDAGFKRRLAFESIIIAAFAALCAATIGAATLEKWGISLGALQLTAGIVLFLVALRSVLDQYAPQEAPEAAPKAPIMPAQKASRLAFSPVAFPTIITPYGIAILVVLVTLREGDTAGLMEIAGVTAVVLVLDLLAMLFADRILKTPFVAPVLGIVGVVLGILQVALGVQAAATGLRLLVIFGTGTG
jgi:multiple antibiotic resistance protein